MISIAEVVSVISIGLVMTVACTLVHAIPDVPPAQGPLMPNVSHALSSPCSIKTTAHVDQIVSNQDVHTMVVVTVNVTDVAVPVLKLA